MAELKISLLGEPILELYGKPLKFDTRKNIALLAYLALTGEKQSRESLVTLLWPELEPSRARAGLRRNLSVLRKTIGEEWFVVDRESIGFNPSREFYLDVDHFNNLLDSCQRHEHRQIKTCPVCLSDLQEAVKLYRDDFLSGFSLRDSPNFDEWQFFQTESLRRDLALSLERLVNGLSAVGKYEVAIPYARRRISLDSLHEQAHRALMHLYTISGQRPAAMRQYNECEHILQKELGVPPDDETTQLYLAIKNMRELSTPTQPDTPGFVTPRHNLPVQTTPFVGRETEIVELRNLICDPDVRLVTILGAGGMGKTRLALEVADSQIESFAHGVYFIRLAPLQSVDSIMPTVVEALDFTYYERGDPQAQLLEYLRDKEILFVLDGFEHLLDGVGWVSKVLKMASDIKILATSRERLSIQGEYLFSLTGMDFPDHFDEFLPKYAVR